MSRAKCIVCADIRDIPSDAVPLVSYGGRRPGRGGSWEYEMLHRLCKAGELRHWKFTRGRTGQLFVMPDEAREALDAVRDKQSSVSTPRPSRQSSDDAIAALTAVLSAVATNQTTMLVAVERIAFALEQIANQQPLARMDDIAICEPSASSNGFHS
jgi:hypothetical protein